MQVSNTLDTGQEHVLAKLGPGEMFGKMALLEDKPRAACVTTLTATVLLAMSCQRFETLVEQHPATMLGLLKMWLLTPRSTCGIVA